MVHRRDRYSRLLEILSDRCRTWTIDDAITENLDLPELMSDYMIQLVDSEECQTAFEVLRSLTVCDPTVGSGAFLLAALDVLDPLYTILMERAEEIAAENPESGGPPFLAEARAHPSPRYWLLKTLCLNNLFGVDLMAEATEIAKLRLFLKLAAQLQDATHIEPLPDLDFNVKPGNLLVGIADGSDIERRFQARGILPFGIENLEEAVKSSGEAYDRFITAQAVETGGEIGASKRVLQSAIREVTEQADKGLYQMRNESQDLEEWRKTHRPFHWFAEFPSVWRNDGFDVIIGNPPYIDKKKVKGYSWEGYQTQKCPNLYAVCMERASTLLNNQGRFAMIVMHNLSFGQRYSPARRYLEDRFSSLWISSYARRPDSLFAGAANVRNTILIAAKTQGVGIQTSRCMRWPKQKRPHLFAFLEYTKPTSSLFYCGDSYQWPFVDSAELTKVFDRLVIEGEPLEAASNSDSEFRLLYKKVALYMLSVYTNPPPTVSATTGLPIQSQTERYGYFYFSSESNRDLALMVLNSRWAYLWWTMFGDAFHVTRTVLAAVPCDIERLATSPPSDMERVSLINQVLELAGHLETEMPEHLAWGRYSDLQVGRYNMLKLRHLTDRADWLLARAWGLTDEQFEAAGLLRDRMVFGNRE